MFSTAYIFVSELAYSSTTHFTNTMVEEGTRAIVVDYIKHRLDKSGYPWENDGRQTDVPPNAVQNAMRQLGDAFEDKFGTYFSDMIVNLNITEDSAPELFSTILDEIFKDGIVNWGRIVALFGFTGRFVVYCCQHQMPNVVDNLVEIVTSYVDNNLRDWMETHNHWEGFLEFQATEPSPSKIDFKWPSFGQVFGILAGVGLITLGALFKHNS